MKTLYRRMNKYVPAVSMALFALTIIAAVLHLCIMSSPAFADTMNSGISRAVRSALAYLTGWIPFSVGESAVMFLPVILVIMTAKCLKVAKGSWRRVFRYIAGMLSAVCFMYIAFVFAFASGYHTPSLDTKLDYERQNLSSEQLFVTAAEILYDIDEVIDDVDFIYSGPSVMPYTYDEMNDLLIEAYDRACEKYTFIGRLDSRVKRIVLSVPMTYTHISGVYSFFTGEANINTNYPDFVIPYTAAHELAHQRGFARENEANFIAFLVCIESDDPYIRYSAYVNMYQYVMSALSSASPEYHYNVLQSADPRVRYEMYSYSDFFDKYRESKAAEISGTINNTYLVLQGTEGTKSYGMVVDLAAAYYMARESDITSEADGER